MAASPIIVSPVLNRLLAQPEGFEFFQAVRLVEQLSRQQAAGLTLPVGYHEDPTQEALRFRASPSLSFPVSQINQVKLLRSSDTEPAVLEMQVAFLGLFGANGLLPQHYTELIIQRQQFKDHALRDFLDIFNHRMLSLFYRSWQKYHFYVGYEQAEQNKTAPDPFTRMLSSLVGNPITSTPKRQTALDEAVLFYAGYFANQRRSAWSLQSMLSDYFAVEVAVQQFQGKWLFLSRLSRTRLGKANHYFNQLGESTVLGARVWDCQHHFRLRIGPLSYAEFKNFLPGGKKLPLLIALTERYVGYGLSFDVQLVLQAAQVPLCQLGGKNPVRLGWNTWLKTQSFQQPVADTVLRKD